MLEFNLPNLHSQCPKIKDLVDTLQMNPLGFFGQFQLFFQLFLLQIWIILGNFEPIYSNFGHFLDVFNGFQRFSNIFVLNPSLYADYYCCLMDIKNWIVPTYISSILRSRLNKISQVPGLNSIKLFLHQIANYSIHLQYISDHYYNYNIILTYF